MVVKPHPQVLALIELSCLRGGIGEGERHLVRGLGNGSLTPDWGTPTDQVAAIQIVAHVQFFAGLLEFWYT